VSCPCPCCDSSGACCGSESCTQATCADCEASGGVWQGANTACDDGSCPCDPPAEYGQCEKCVGGEVVNKCSESQYCCLGVCQDEPCACEGSCDGENPCPEGCYCCALGCSPEPCGCTNITLYPDFFKIGYTLEVTEDFAEFLEGQFSNYKRFMERRGYACVTVPEIPTDRREEAWLDSNPEVLCEPTQYGLPAGSNPNCNAICLDANDNYVVSSYTDPRRGCGRISTLSMGLALGAKCCGTIDTNAEPILLGYPWYSDHPLGGDYIYPCIPDGASECNPLP
jgi:hypothetical protein